MSASAPTATTPYLRPCSSPTSAAEARARARRLVRPLAVALVSLAVVVGALSVAGTLAVVAVVAVGAATLPVVAARLALDGFACLRR